MSFLAYLMWLKVKRVSKQTEKRKNVFADKRFGCLLGLDTFDYFLEQFIAKNENFNNKMYNHNNRREKN
jgi:hypothetical protein